MKILPEMAVFIWPLKELSEKWQKALSMFPKTEQKGTIQIVVIYLLWKVQVLCIKYVKRRYVPQTPMTSQDF